MRPATARKAAWWPYLAAAAVLLGVAAAGLALWPGGPARPPEPPVAETPAPVPLATQAEVLALVPAAATMLRLRENPRVFVLVFPDLEAQGAALNRVAALVEKAGLPRDRLLTREELASAIARSGSTAATWYLAHDYRGAALERFFALAARDAVELGPGERWVATQLGLARATLAEDGPLALISVAASGAEMPDAAFRAAVLRHEVSHGHYFTLPAFAEHVRRVWQARFTETDRVALRRFLASEGYDAEDEELMANEAQAYLLFTPDSRLFSAALAGLTEAQLERLRGLLRDGLPEP